MASDYFIAHRIVHSGMEFHYSISQSQKPPVPFVRHRIGGSGSSRRARPLPFKAIDFWASYLSPPPLSLSLALLNSLEVNRGTQIVEQFDTFHGKQRFDKLGKLKVRVPLYQRNLLSNPRTLKSMFVAQAMHRHHLGYDSN